MQLTAKRSFTARMNGRDIRAKKGEAVEVTEREAEQLRGLVEKAKPRKEVRHER